MVSVLRTKGRLRLVLALTFGTVLAVALVGASVVGARRWLEPPQELSVLPLPLDAALGSDDAEISGLAWWGERLVVLPQYPHRFPVDGYDGSLFSISRASLDAWRRGDSDRVESKQLPIRMPGLMERRGFQGFEAIAFDGDHAYLTVEMDDEGAMWGLLVKGRVHHEAGHLELDVERSVRLRPQTEIRNLAYEAISVRDGRLWVFYEANGVANGQPHVLQFDTELRPMGETPMDPIEYRITDVSEVDRNGRFYAANYHYPKCRWAVGACSLRARFGDGSSHARSEAVERIVELEHTQGGVRLTSRPPMQLALLEEDARNWEGLVRYADGFIAATDLHPESMIAYIPAGL